MTRKNQANLCRKTVIANSFLAAFFNNRKRRASAHGHDDHHDMGLQSFSWRGGSAKLGGERRRKLGGALCSDSYL